jgi:AcrR family transcriptional regulator
METREKLLQAAKNMFSQKGYWGTRVSDIVKEAGVSQGTFYIYFKSKDAIFKELVLQVKEKIIDILKNPEGKTLMEKLENINLKLLHLLYENKSITEIFLYQLFSTNKELKNIYFETVEIARKSISGMIQEAIDKKEIRQVNPENTADIFIGYKKMLFEDFILKKDYPFKEVLKLSQEGIKVIYKGLKK